MSYTFSQVGGTNHGIKTYNQIFAKNRTTVGAADYWDPVLESGDTVLCKMTYTHASNNISNYKLLTWYDFDQGGALVYGSHWIGTGIYLCYCNEATGWDIGDFVCQPNLSSTPTPSPGARAIVKIASSTSEARQPMGVALEDATNGTFATIAMMGLWPMKRNVVLDRDEAIYPTNTGNGEVTNIVPGGGSFNAGAFGKAIDPDFDIITSTAATPTTVNGAQVCIWGTAAESF